jgi:hypothetical protein
MQTAEDSIRDNMDFFVPLYVFCIRIVWVYTKHISLTHHANVRCSKDCHLLVRNAKALNSKGRILENNKEKSLAH